MIPNYHISSGFNSKEFNEFCKDKLKPYNHLKNINQPKTSLFSKKNLKLR